MTPSNTTVGINEANWDETNNYEDVTSEDYVCLFVWGRRGGGRPPDNCKVFF